MRTYILIFRTHLIIFATFLLIISVSLLKNNIIRFVRVYCTSPKKVSAGIDRESTSKSRYKFSGRFQIVSPVIGT